MSDTNMEVETPQVESAAPLVEEVEKVGETKEQVGNCLNNIYLLSN